MSLFLHEVAGTFDGDNPAKSIVGKNLAKTAAINEAQFRDGPLQCCGVHLAEAYERRTFVQEEKISARIRMTLDGFKFKQ